jgi:hypothetical protein
MRRWTTRLAATAVLVTGTLLAAPGPASASTTALLLPQSTAFAVLGHSCGGIQEQAYASGFAPGTGYPTGDVYLVTRCGGSGRGGGYTSTTYDAWVAVTWDLTATVVSYQRLSTAPTVDPTLTAFDGYGNEVYNSSGSAYLVLAPGFVPAPRVAGVAPTAGPATGGTTVTLSGTGFTGATGVSFGGVSAASFTVNGDTSVTAVTPAAPAGVVDVTVTTVGGTSALGPADRFTFVAAPTVASLSPTFGSSCGGTSVTITGTDLSGAASVAFDENPATRFTVDSDTQVTAVSPAGSGTVDVRVTTVGGTSATSSADRFSYLPLCLPF